MPTDAPIGPTQQTGDLLVVFGRLRFGETRQDNHWHIFDEASAHNLQSMPSKRIALCGQRVIAGGPTELPWRVREQVCDDCHTALAFPKWVSEVAYNEHFVLLSAVSYPALPITDERAAGRTLWSATASCDACGTLLSVEGVDPETLGLAMLAAKRLLDQHRNHHPSGARGQSMELLWPDDATPAIAEHLRGFLGSAGHADEEEQAEEEQEQEPGFTFTPVSPICAQCGVDLSQSRTTHKSDCPLFDPENAARLAEWAAEDAATEDE